MLSRYSLCQVSVEKWCLSLKKLWTSWCCILYEWYGRRYDFFCPFFSDSLILSETLVMALSNISQIVWTAFQAICGSEKIHQAKISSKVKGGKRPLKLFGCYLKQMKERNTTEDAKTGVPRNKLKSFVHSEEGKKNSMAAHTMCFWGQARKK